MCIYPGGACVCPGCMCLSRGVSVQRGCLSGGVCLPGGVSQHAMEQTPPREQTDTCKNITFLQLLLRTVNMETWKTW